MMNRLHSFLRIQGRKFSSWIREGRWSWAPSLNQNKENEANEELMMGRDNFINHNQPSEAAQNVRANKTEEVVFK